MKATKINVQYSDNTETYEVGDKGVRSITIQTNNERVKIEFEKQLDWDYKIIPLFMVKALDIKEDQSSR